MVDEKIKVSSPVVEIDGDEDDKNYMGDDKR